MEFINTLADFYKHCLNVAGHIRPNNSHGPSWCGWMRCKIIPYLIDGKVYGYVDSNLVEAKDNNDYKFKELLLYTLQDYIEFISISDYYDDDKIKYLITEVKNMSQNDILNMIETNNDKFPTYQDCDNNNILEESFNPQLIIDITGEEVSEEEDIYIPQ